MDEIRELTRVRVLLSWREPEALFWVFAFPVLLAGVLGFAFRRQELEPSRVALAPAAASLEGALERAELLEALRVGSAAEGERLLRRGAVDALLLEADGREPPRVRLEPDRPEAELARLRLLLALEGKGSERSALDVDPVTEAGSRYIDFLVPGLLGMNLMGTGMWLVGFAVADLRQRKVLRRLLVTPMRRSSFLLSFLLSRLVFLLLEVAALVGFAAWALGVPFRAGLVSFTLSCLLGAVTFTALGMLTTARTRTLQGASGMLNVAMLPMWLLSGVFFSYERFPEAWHGVLRLLPLTALNDALRALMLEGAGIADVAGELALLLVWAAASFALALRIFRWE